MGWSRGPAAGQDASQEGCWAPGDGRRWSGHKMCQSYDGPLTVAKAVYSTKYSMHSSNNNEDLYEAQTGVTSESQQGDGVFNPSTASSNRDDNDERSVQSGAGSEEEEEEYLSDVDEETNYSVAQDKEQLDCPVFQCNRDKPMMEVEAGSNVWFQAIVIQESWNEVRVLFPAPTEDDKEVREWVSKTSSRIWRGSLKSKDWKYLGKGAWEPRASAVKTNRAKSRAAKPKRRRPAGPRRTGSTADDTATATGTSEGVAAHEEVDDDVASPRAKKARRARPASSNGGGSGGKPLSRPDRPRGDEVSSSSREQQMEGACSDPAADATGPSHRAGEPADDPLAAWFQMHFVLLQEKGLLGAFPLADNPEAGCLPADDGTAPAAGDMQLQPQRGRSTGLRELQGLAPWGWERGKPDTSDEESGEGEGAAEGEEDPDEPAPPPRKRRPGHQQARRHDGGGDDSDEDEQPCPVRHKQRVMAARKVVGKPATSSEEEEEEQDPLLRHKRQQHPSSRQQQQGKRVAPGAREGAHGAGSVSPDTGRTLKSVSPHQASSQGLLVRRPDGPPAAASSKPWPGPAAAQPAPRKDAARHSKGVSGGGGHARGPAAPGLQPQQALSGLENHCVAPMPSAGKQPQRFSAPGSKPVHHTGSAAHPKQHMLDGRGAGMQRPPVAGPRAGPGPSQHHPVKQDALPKHHHHHKKLGNGEGSKGMRHGPHATPQQRPPPHMSSKPVQGAHNFPSGGRPLHS